MRDVLDFVYKYGSSNLKDLSEGKLKFILQQHVSFGTIIVDRNEKEVTSMVRWNQIAPDTLYILDVIIHPDCRGISNLLDFITKNVRSLPNANDIKWLIYRRSKNPESGYHVLNMNKIYKREGEI